MFSNESLIQFKVSIKDFKILYPSEPVWYISESIAYFSSELPWSLGYSLYTKKFALVCDRVVPNR